MTLKTQLDDPSSPVRQFFGQRLPNNAEARVRYRGAMVGATTALPNAGNPAIPWDVLGHAISARLLWELRPGSDGTVGGLSVSQAERWISNRDLVDQVVEASASRPSELAPLEAAGVAWVVGLLDRAGRSGRYDDPRLDALRRASRLADCGPAPLLADIANVARICDPLVEADRLIGTTVAPTFAGSSAVGGADADYITNDGVLVDIKATKNLGFRSRDVLQIVAYALLDWQDAFEIHTVGLLLARQGRVVRWNLDELLTSMAGEPMHLVTVRDDLRSQLQG